ncbi:MAG: hypothetical protein OEV00_03250 [Acidobacteriota bacterium]|nr:hypothetical protein [Acidobacteriota bacterium]MDH3784326.1 hypothetical protein [Acidobacteriota bacterium]
MRPVDRGRWRHGLFAVYLIVCLGAVTWPGYPWYGARIRPLVLGLPWSLAWLVGWIVLTFFVVATYEWTRPRLDGDGDR